MEEFIPVLKDILFEKGLSILILAIIVCALTFAIKIPYKMLTGHIKNEKLRKLSNKGIIIIVFALSTLCVFVGNFLFPEYVVGLSFVQILSVGSSAITIYCLAEKTKVTITQEENEDLKAMKKVADKGNEIVKDGKISKEEKVDIQDNLDNALKDFYKSIKK